MSSASVASVACTAFATSAAPAHAASSLVSRLAANVAHASNCTVLAVLSVTARAWALPVAQPCGIALAKYSTHARTRLGKNRLGGYSSHAVPE